MEIEEISEKSPGSNVRTTVEPAVGLREFQVREIAFKLGIPPDLTQQMVRTLLGCFRAFHDLDATMVEVNPLVIRSDKRIVALAAKMTFDTNTLFRHPQIAELRDKPQDDPRESQAADRRVELHRVGRQYRLHCQWGGIAMADHRPCGGDHQRLW